MPSALSFLGSGNREPASVKLFEIRLDESNLILRGNEDEASSVLLKGTLVLCLSEPLRVQGIRLRFTGERQVGWSQSGSSVKQDDEFLRKIWDFGSSNGKRTSEILPAGNHEYPFDMILPGSTPESVEGMLDTWLVYRLKATIERGLLQQNSTARKQIRLIRTLDTGALELAHAMSVENVWPEKVDYALSTPTKAVIFGTTVQVDFRLVPLLKGLKFGKIVTEVTEKQEFAVQTRTPKRKQTIIRSIAKDEYHHPDDAETVDIEGQEGFLFSRSIPLPQSLRKCLQTVDVMGIKIRHSLVFNVQMHNPDGHISELHATLPLFLFISPNLPIDDNNDLVNRGSHSINATTAMDQLTPPQYGEHQFDQLYSDIDPSGYMTPAGGASGMNTPLQSRSRSVSTDNLVSLDGVASTDFAASTLQTRLSNLDVAGTSGIARERHPQRSQLSTSSDGADSSFDISRTGNSTPQSSLPGNSSFYHPSNGPSPGDSNAVSRRVSEEDDALPSPDDPQHIEYVSAEDLAKVPSYTTALQSQTRTPVNDGLPTYQSATRGPLPLPPQQPNQAHISRINRAA